MTRSFVTGVLFKLVIALFFFNLTGSPAFALPAFGKKENLPCVVCHTNGSAPHLTKTGYLYRRAAFHFPANIGNKEADEKAQVMQHFSAAINVAYENVNQKDPTTGKTTTTSNQFNLPEVAVFPLVGGVLGNFGSFSEFDIAPGTQGSDGATLAIADLRYVSGSSDFFWTIRSGFISSEGYGAGDQWIDDGNLPLMDTLTAQYNQDTLVMPFGAMGESQLGTEIGASYKDTHLTLGVYNGFDGSNGLAAGEQSSLTPALTNPENKNAKDYRLQIDQFLGEIMEVTVAYYNGIIPLLDPTNKLPWQNKFTSSRVYVTGTAWQNVLDFLVGAGSGTQHYVNPGSDAVAGSFKNEGEFFGFNYYAQPHLTLSGRVDHFRYSTSADKASARGYALMASLPFDNNLFVFHYNNTNSDLAGTTRDFRLEWRLFF